MITVIIKSVEERNKIYAMLYTARLIKNLKIMDDILMRFNEGEFGKEIYFLTRSVVPNMETSKILIPPNLKGRMLGEWFKLQDHQAKIRFKNERIKIIKESKIH